ncbi:MAG: hypothetical protein M0R80_13570 [Proteobacteria bacterium]|jgi:hypothetical protein|nr:hypothetical protein [Pseudomonadota bacterium]
MVEDLQLRHFLWDEGTKNGRKLQSDEDRLEIENLKAKLKLADAVVELARKGMGIMPVAWMREFHKVIKAYDNEINPSPTA